jgi:hypothetical protein
MSEEPVPGRVYLTQKGEVARQVVQVREGCVFVRAYSKGTVVWRVRLSRFWRTYRECTMGERRRIQRNE